MERFEKGLPLWNNQGVWVGASNGRIVFSCVEKAFSDIGTLFFIGSFCKSAPL